MRHHGRLPVEGAEDQVRPGRAPEVRDHVGDGSRRHRRRPHLGEQQQPVAAQQVRGER
jgi:hypothetical protein